MAYQAKSYGRVYHNLYHLVQLYKRAKKDVGKNQGFSHGECHWHDRIRKETHHRQGVPWTPKPYIFCNKQPNTSTASTSKPTS